MRQFLRETWELWYWSLFCPSRLQKRMNELIYKIDSHSFDAEDTRAIDLLLLHLHPSFTAQVILLISLFNSPLILGAALQGRLEDWLLVTTTLLGAYGLACWFLAAGLHLALLFNLIYFLQPYSPYQALQPLAEAWSIVPHMTSTLLFLVVSGIILTPTPPRSKRPSSSSFFVPKSPEQFVITNTGRLVNFAGSIALITGIIAGGSTLLIEGATINAAYIVAGGIAGGIAGGTIGFTTIRDMRIITASIAIGLAGITVGSVTGIAVITSATIMVARTLPIPTLALAGWLIGSVLAPRCNRWTGVIGASILILLTIEQQGWVASLLMAGWLLVGYYHLIPTLLMAGINMVIAPPTPTAPDALNSLRRLPPCTSELLWFSLPHHESLLGAAFRDKVPPTQVSNLVISRPVITGDFSLHGILQQMRASPLPALPRTARRALPLIVTDQLLAVDNATAISATAQVDHPLLPLLVPIAYERTEGNTPSATSGEPETTLMLPRLLPIAEDVGTALAAGSVFLRQRGLEGCLDKLARLQGQLPGLGLPAAALPRWRAVVEKWQQVLETEVATLRATAVGEVVNPFQRGNPLRPTRAHLFKGRQAFADALVRHLLDRSRPTLVLHGPRRCGKSSFLLHLPRLLSSDIVPIYLDLQSAAMTGSEGDFCYGLAHAISRDMRSQGLAVPTLAPRPEFLARPYPALEDWLEQAEPKLDGRRVLLCLDEFEKLGEALHTGKLSSALLNELRHLIQHREALSFLFCGVQTLDELGPDWSNYFISVSPIEMTYLEPDEARALLEDPDPAFDLRYAPGIVEEVSALTRCQPYLLQLLGEMMVLQANLHQSRLLTPPLLAAALHESLSAGAPYFTNLWEEATGRTPAERHAGQTLLHALAHSQALPPLAGDTLAALRRLQRYHVLQPAGATHRFEIPLVERWVRERAHLT